MIRPRSNRELPAAAAYTYRWDFFSARLKRLVSGAGTLRLDYFILLECNPDLEHYEPFPSYETKMGNEAKPIRCDAILTFRNGEKSLAVVTAGKNHADFADEEDDQRKRWADASRLRYIKVSQEEIRGPNCYLANCYTMFPWLSEVHEPSAGETLAILGAIAHESKPVALARLAQITDLDCEIVMAAVCRAQARGIIQIEEIRTRKLDYHSRVFSRSF